MILDRFSVGISGTVTDFEGGTEYHSVSLYRIKTTSLENRMRKPIENRLVTEYHVYVWIQLEHPIGYTNRRSVAFPRPQDDAPRVSTRRARLTDDGGSPYGRELEWRDAIV